MALERRDIAVLSSLFIYFFFIAFETCARPDARLRAALMQLPFDSFDQNESDINRLYAVFTQDSDGSPVGISFRHLANIKHSCLDSSVCTFVGHF